VCPTEWVTETITEIEVRHRIVTITANYRQVYVPYVPPYVANEGLLHVFVTTSANLVANRDFRVEIRNIITGTVGHGDLRVNAGSSQSTHSYSIPIDLNTFNLSHFTFRFTQNNSSTLAFTQVDLQGTPTTTSPNFSITPNGFLVASSGRIGRLNFEGEGLFSSSFKLETIVENNRLVSNLTFFGASGAPSAAFTSDHLQVPTVYAESISGNSLTINANSITSNTFRANGTIHAGRIEGEGGAWINVNEGAAAVAFTASMSHDWWTNRITVTLNRQVIRAVTVTVQYKVVLGNWHTMNFTFSGSTTSIRQTGVGAALGYENVSIISNRTFTQTPAGSGVRIQGNLNWNGRQLFINQSDNTVRAY
jgi:hypothetical protein